MSGIASAAIIPASMTTDHGFRSQGLQRHHNVHGRPQTYASGPRLQLGPSKRVRPLCNTAADNA